MPSFSSPKLVVANWKSHLTRREVKVWLEVVTREQIEKVASDLRVVVCPSYVHLEAVHAALGTQHTGVQTLSPFPNGPYTGAVSAQQAAEYASVAIVGHIERRSHFGETAQHIGQQVVQAVENDLTPIIAVDRATWASQLNFLSEQQISASYLMYEPAEAISTATGGGHPSDVAEVEEFAKMVRAKYPVRGVLYGGSVDATNARAYFKSAAIAGAVVGAASIRTATFQEILAVIAA